MKGVGTWRWKFDGLLLLVVLPLVGLWFNGRPVREYLEFPPLTRYVAHAGFDWTIWAGLLAFSLAVLLPFVIRVVRAWSTEPAMPAVRRFPAWGWAGVALGAVSWWLAWTRHAWFAPLQPFTFSPLWVAYIMVVNALAWRRTGHCMLTDRPGYVAKLAGLSAVFWWYFEYLNRFVQNWYYEGVSTLTPWQYVLFASLPFATVLPAVLGTEEWLASYPRLTAGLGRFCPVRMTRPPLVGAGVLLVSGCGLALIGVWPDLLFPLLWISPLAVMTAFQAVKGEATLFAPLAAGDWRRIVRLAVAALICGFFWEMWNVFSLAKWKYAVPFVGEFRLFEMPVLGYLGYLPFGLECAVIADLLLGRPGEAAEAVARPVSAPGQLRRLGWMLDGVLRVGLALYFFILPGFLVVRELREPAYAEGRIPPLAWRLHQDLTPRYACWARARIASGVAAHLSLYDVPSTEWPLFGSVYYLWATETLQQAWEATPDGARDGLAPAVYAREAIEASADLLRDPVHHTWVKEHWGTNYLHHKNVFFRSLLIAGLTSRERLVGDGRDRTLLEDQVVSLARELAASPLGVLEDYPQECYPIDVLCAVACIRRADAVLGTDHSAFVEQARRGFSGAMLDACGLIPYSVDERTGAQWEPSRGVGNSYVLLFVREIWPDWADAWYARYEEWFWQDVGWAAGFREFPRGYAGENAENGYDVDAGPIFAGFSPAANAFGLGAATVNGRLDHAATLRSQVLGACWPLPDGSLLGARLLSSREHAPYLGEACMLFLLTRTPAVGVPWVSGGRVPWDVRAGLAVMFGVGGLLLWGGARRLRCAGGVPCGKNL